MAVALEPKIAAIVYDFDGTIAPGNIQEHSLIPRHLESTSKEFWATVGERKKQLDIDQISVYLALLIERAVERGKLLTSAVLRDHGRATPFFEGVETWFDRINSYAGNRGLALEHYVISSANEEMVQGTKIAGHFRRIFGCKYVYNDAGHAVWPGVIVNYTTKTQYLFRINKGVETYWNDDQVNRWVPMQERRIPFERMIYIGDGDTDIPSMKMVRYQGGHSVAVFDPVQWKEGSAQTKAYNLIAEDRAHFVVPADYTDGSQLDVTVRGILGRIARTAGWREQPATSEPRKSG